LIEPPEDTKHVSVKICRERFITALLKEEEALKIIQNKILKSEVLKQLGLISIDQLYQELEVLQKQSIYFSIYKDKVSLQAFDINNIISKSVTSELSRY
jgi:hypothetical protein